MKMDAGLDTGDMLLKGETEITPETTGGELHDKLAEIGAELIVRTLREWNDIKPQKQDDSLSCYAAKIDKAESLLDLAVPAAVLARKIGQIIHDTVEVDTSGATEPIFGKTLF